jgi:hypothetical protein
MRISNNRLAAENRAKRYLNSKQAERQNMERKKMDNFMCFFSGLAIAFIIGCGYEIYIMGAL